MVVQSDWQWMACLVSNYWWRLEVQDVRLNLMHKHDSKAFAFNIMVCNKSNALNLFWSSRRCMQHEHPLVLDLAYLLIQDCGWFKMLSKFSLIKPYQSSLLRQDVNVYLIKIKIIRSNPYNIKNIYKWAKRIRAKKDCVDLVKFLQLWTQSCIRCFGWSFKINGT